MKIQCCIKFVARQHTEVIEHLVNDQELIWEGVMIAIRQMQLCIAAGVLQFERMNAVNNCEQTPFY